MTENQINHYLGEGDKMFVATLTDTTTGVRYEEMDQDTIWAIIRLALGFKN